MYYIEKYKEQIFYLLACLIILTLPLKSNYNSIAVIALTSFGCYYIFTNRKTVKFWIPSNSVFCFISLFIYILFQGFYSEPDYFVKNVIRSVPILIFPLLFFYLRQIFDLKFVLKRVLYFLILSSVLLSIFLLVVAFYRQFLFSPNFENINWYYFAYYDFTDILDIHPTYLGLYNCLAIVVCLNKLLKSEGNRWCNIIAILFLSIIVLLSGSRIILFNLILITILYCFKIFKLLRRGYKIIVVSAIVLVPLIVFNFVPIAKERMIDMTFDLNNNYNYARYGENTRENGGLSPRIQMWSCAIDITMDNILFGNGFGYTQLELNECYIRNGNKSYADSGYQTHSQYFNNFARGGIIGVLLLFFVYFYALFMAFKVRDLMYISFGLIIIISSITENILNLQFGIVFYAFFNSFFFYSKKTMIN